MSRPPKLSVRRFMFFAQDPKALAAFYVRAFGLTVLLDERTFVDLGSGSFRLAFHKAPKASPGGNKLCFFAEDIAAAVAALTAAGAKMKKPRGQAGELWFCDGVDPEGNLFQISNRA